MSTFVIKNPEGLYYTGETFGGVAVFSEDRTEAVELFDNEEVAAELSAAYMPKDATSEVLR